MARQPNQRGFTLIEIMVTVGIVAIVMGGVTMGIKSLAKSDLRSTASQMASCIRFLFDRARSTGRYYRLVVDLDNGKFWAEESEDKFFLVREKESGRKGRGPDEEEDAKDKKGGKASLLGGTVGGLDAESVYDEKGNLKIGHAKTLFKSFKETQLKVVSLKKSVKIADVYTAKQREPYTSGRAYVYFFPQGFGERAIVHLSDGGSTFYSLETHPLTGRVVVQGGYMEIPKEFDRADDLGNRAVER